MRELNSTKIIGLDEGYGNIKTANTVTPTAITAYDTEPIFSGNILKYGGRYYHIGEGRTTSGGCRLCANRSGSGDHKEFLPDKWRDDDFYLLTLAGIAREMHREHLTREAIHPEAIDQALEHLKTCYKGKFDYQQFKTAKTETADSLYEAERELSIHQRLEQAQVFEIPSPLLFKCERISFGNYISTNCKFIIAL